MEKNKDNYKPGIFGEKSTFGKRFAEGFGNRPKVVQKEHKPQGAALVKSKALLAKKK